MQQKQTIEKVKNGVVTLTGDVNSFWDKTHAYADHLSLKF